MAFKGEKRELFNPNSSGFKTDNLYTRALKDETGIVNAQNAKTIPLHFICQRYENLFIKDPDDLKVLKNSIKEIGLKNPITVVSIEIKLKSLRTLLEKDEMPDLTKAEAKKEIVYLEAEQNKGKKYTISAGHRRFDACMCLALETFDLKVDYTKDIASQFDKVADDLDHQSKELHKTTDIRMRLTDLEKEQLAKFEKLNIEAIIDDKNFDIKDDAKVYQDTNLTSRSVTKFEIISNVYKQLTLTGEIDNFLDSKGKLNFKKFQEYLKDEHNEEVDLELIRRNIKMYETFRDDLKDLIYNGKLGIKVAMRILPKYPLLSDKQIDSLVKKIDQDEFDINEWLKQFAKPKKKYETKEDKLKKEFVLALNRVKSGKLSIDDLIKMYSK